MTTRIMFWDGPQQEKIMASKGYSEARELLKAEIRSGACFCITDAAFLDGACILEVAKKELTILRSLLESGRLVIEGRTADEILSKPFKFSSLGTTVGPCTASEFVSEHPEYRGVLDLMEEFSKPFDWKATGITVSPLTEIQAEALGIEPTANRTAVFNAADELGTPEAMAVKEAFNEAYISALAGQHACNYRVTEDLKVIPTGYYF